MITHFRQAIEETLPWLSSFGADPTGGMTRLLYSPEWLETQQQFKEGANKRENSSRLTQSFHFFMFEPIFSPVNALNQPI